MTIKIWIVDDHAVVRQGLRAILELQQDFCVVGEAGNGQEMLCKWRDYPGDVVLLDLLMPHMDGLETLRRFREVGNSTPVVMLTSSLEDKWLLEALKFGAASYLLKTAHPTEIVEAIRTVTSGKTYLHSEVQPWLVESFFQAEKKVAHQELTAREHEVLSCLASGMSNQEIADTLHIGIKTVKTHVGNILLKLSVQDRTQAAIYAIRHGLDKCSPFSSS
ncbi:response regulator [Alicyclobacillus tolerans]|uniref:NarL family two-component system response regulator LiaR n=1 Tax=Alicyclobacillus tolerans TaxID=90970 RepID=A0ABT9LWN4_9BACL|nr:MULTISPECIES: response regulator transcription factor [Alicyclobacillus]MDP9728586.1 NarL family two-component system response regulator LiaR [Alicyclobacillus tengchongensis]QRF22581.1 response regulator transcription factor [Alicyclobacillus sp. TC]